MRVRRPAGQTGPQLTGEEAQVKLENRLGFYTKQPHDGFGCTLLSGLGHTGKICV